MAAMPLHEAIRAAYKGRSTQAELSRRLGVAQPTVSRWVGATRPTEPSLDELAAIEDACQRPRGFILSLAGYVQPAATVIDLLEVDPALDDDARHFLTVTYQSLVADRLDRDQRRA